MNSYSRLKIEKAIILDPGLLLYCRGMFAYLLANQCTSLSIVNGTRAIIHKVVPYPNSKAISSKTIWANK